MVLLPGCACCTSATCLQLYQQLRNSSGIEVTVNAADYIRTQKGTYTGNPQVCGKQAGDEFGTTQLFPGSEYAGTFLLSKVTAGSWRYEYAISGLRCSNFSPQLSSQMFSSVYGYTFNLGISFGSFSHCDMSAVNYITKTGFDCTTQNYACLPGFNVIGFSQPIVRASFGGSGGIYSICQDGNFNIPNPSNEMFASVQNPCVFSDEKNGPSATFATQSESGSLAITFSNITFIP